MTSLDIAQVTGKMHKDVLKAIRNMEPAWLKVNGRHFALVDYKDSKGELRPCYSLTKTECLYNRGTGLMLYEEEALSHVEKEKNNIRCRILKDYSYICSQNSV